MQQSTCSIDGCDGRPCNGRGWCSKHYQRWWKYGDPLAGRDPQPRGATPIERFWAKVNKNGPIPAYRPELGRCWVWTKVLRNGYGALYIDGHMEYAHRFSYELLIGPIPEDMHLDHLCRVRACVNPSHLEPVTQQENIARGEAGAYLRARTHCPYGHPYDEENTYVWKGGRSCRICVNRKGREYYQRKKKLQ